MTTVLPLQVEQIEVWFEKHTNVDGVSHSGNVTTEGYSENLDDETELVLVASGEEMVEATDIFARLAHPRQQMRRLMDAFTEELDTTMRPELQEMFLRRYKKGDATDNKHRDTFSIAVLHYWGDFGGDNLEYKVGTQVASVPLKQGDLIIMCGSRIRHGCKESTSGHRYALVGFHNLVAPTKKSHGDK